MRRKKKLETFHSVKNLTFSYPYPTCMAYSEWFETNTEGKQKVEGERAAFPGPLVGLGLLEGGTCPLLELIKTQFPQPFQKLTQDRQLLCASMPVQV